MEKGGFYLTSRCQAQLISPQKTPFTSNIDTEMYLQLKTSLQGIWKSSRNFFTKCEEEGFCKIFFY